MGVREGRKEGRREGREGEEEPTAAASEKERKRKISASSSQPDQSTDAAWCEYEIRSISTARWSQTCSCRLPQL